MKKATLDELGFEARGEAVRFLKKLWTGEGADCPVCGGKLELLHRKAKKNVCDWQCPGCGRVFRTIHLLDELNETMPK
ncbi:MAG: hypothetical protein IJM17_04620 [Firmicutes bacterium]|nr:hypothetical protein [Bacillota bacterium]